MAEGFFLLLSKMKLGIIREMGLQVFRTFYRQLGPKQKEMADHAS
jgi:hypothetical protein